MNTTFAAGRSMFDKGWSKPGKRGEGPGRSGIIQEAERARLEREQQRKKGQHVVKIQRMVRKGLARQRVLNELRRDFDKKIADIEKLAAWLEASQGVKGFTPPVDTTVRLSREFCYCYSPRRKGALQRLDRLCAVVLLRSLRNTEDAATNVALAVVKSPAAHGCWWRQLLAILVDSLRLVQYRDLPRPPKSPGPAVLPAVLVLERLLQQSPPAAGLCRPLVSVPLLRTVRALCIAQGPCFSDPLKAKRPVQPDPVLLPLARLLSSLLSGPEAPPSEAFVVQLLSLPLFLPLSGLALGPHLPALVSATQRLLHPSLDAALPASPCPSAPSSLWLTANLCAILTTRVRGSSRRQLLETVTSGLLQSTLSLLVELVGRLPPAALSDREVISLEKKGTHIETLVVAPVVVEQVQSVVREDVLRALSRVVMAGFRPSELQSGATPAEAKEIQNAHKLSTLQLTDESQKQRQRREARWFGARWATKLMSSLGSLTTRRSADGDDGEGDEEAEGGGSGGKGGSAEAGGSKGPEEEAAAEGVVAPVELLQAWASFVSVLLWKAQSACHRSYGLSSANNVSVQLLNTLAFSTTAVPRLWTHVLSLCKVDSASSVTPVGSSPTSQSGLHASLAVLCAVYTHMLMVLDDSEIHDDGFPLPLHHVIRVVKFCKPVALSGCRAEASGALVMAPATTGSSGGGGSQDMDFGAFLHRSVARLLRSLFDRWSRRAFCSPETWVISGMEDWRLRREVMNQTLFGLTLLRVIPFCIPLADRMVIFNAWLAADRERNQPKDVPAIAVKIRRAHMLHDSIHMLTQIGERLKSRIIVIYYSELGVQEQGIDAGGLFKEFWTELSSLVFDLEFGLFQQTPDGLLYPNSASFYIHGPEHLRFYEFVGRILGKAMYECITISPVFAQFFLGFIRGGYNFMNALNDLERLDPELYKNLTFLRTYEGDVSELGLTFTVVDQDLGKSTEVELVDNGANVPVTNENKLRYIGLVAKHHMYDRLRLQSEAFVRGFREIIDPIYLQMFNEAELQILISGSPSGIDVEDLKHNTTYTGGYIAADWHVRRFWRVVESFSPSEQSALLRFVTGCPRPPPLGFRGLQPPFTLHRVSISKDEKLPSASTCFNVLKLPTYSSEAVMKEKLLTAIFSGSGFELS